MKDREIIKFCKNKCCPVIELLDDKVLLGDVNGPEGLTIWSKEQFKDFIDAAKEGKFDNIIE